MKLVSGALRISQAGSTHTHTPRRVYRACVCVLACVRPSTTNVGVNGVLSDFAICKNRTIAKAAAITIDVAVTSVDVAAHVLSIFQTLPSRNF